MDFTAWWEQVVARLRHNGFEPLPSPKAVDREACEAGMDPDEWAWIYFHADEEQPTGPDDPA